MATRKNNVPPVVAAKKAELLAQQEAARIAAGGQPAPAGDGTAPVVSATPAPGDGTPPAPTPTPPAPTPTPPAAAPSPTPGQPAPIATAPLDLNTELDFGAPAPSGGAPTSGVQPDIAQLQAGLQTAVQALQAAQSAQEAAAQREADLQRQVQELTTRLSSPAVKTREQVEAELAALDIAAEELTPEEQEAYSETTRSVVSKLVRKELAKLAPFIKNASLKTFELENEFGNFRGAAGQPSDQYTALAATTARIEEEQFVDRMKLRVTNGQPQNYDKLVKSPAWKLFLTRPVKGGSTVAGTIQQMHQNRDLEGIARVFSTFVSANPMESLAMPAPQAGAGGNGGTAPQQVTMKLSQLTEMQDRFQKKQIKKPELDAFRKTFDEAKAAGRVDMNA